MRKKEIKTISPSLQALPNFNFDEGLNNLINSGINALHIDLMDATATDSFGINPNVLINKKINDLIIDFHIMSSNPINLIKTIPIINGCFVHTHLRMVYDYKDFVTEVKKHNLMVGITLDLNDDLSKLKDFIKDIEFVNFMSVVNIGKTGELFDERVYKKIDEFKEMYGSNFIFCVDGSIRENHLNILKRKCNLMVIGSILYKSDDWKERISELNTLLNK